MANDVKYQWYALGNLPIGTKSCMSRAVVSVGGTSAANCHGAGEEDMRETARYRKDPEEKKWGKCPEWVLEQNKDLEKEMIYSG